jgi:hypothetical protein
MGRAPQAGWSRPCHAVERDSSPLDAETLAGIINLLMRIDARLEKLVDLLAEEDEDGEENDA